MSKMASLSDTPQGPFIGLEHVTKRFGPRVVAVHDLSLSVHPGEFLALLGPSGCGKSTTLRLLAGLETPDAGEVHLLGRCVAGGRTWVPPDRRRIGMVFQDYALFPHLSIRENIAFPKRVDGSKVDKQRVDELLELVGMSGIENRYPHALSGGQQQRIAIARALAGDPAIILLDEPFSNLDAALRESTREEVRTMLSHAGVATILVTHDQEEALSMADTVAVMFDGKIVQSGTPEEIYLRPSHKNVANFVGNATFIEGTAVGATVECALGSLSLTHRTHGPVEVFLRPDSMSLTPDKHGTARVVETRFFGPYQIARIELEDASTLDVRVGPHAVMAPRTSVTVQVEGPVVGYKPSEVLSA